MLLEILKRTPPWVFVLFAALVFFGVMQSRTRQIALVRVTILPVVLIGLSLWAYGALSAPTQQPSSPGSAPSRSPCCSTGS